MVENGPVKDVIYQGQNIDLSLLPIPRFYEQDGGGYTTAGLLVVRNLEKTKELSYSRMRLKGRNRLSMNLHSRGHLEVFKLQSFW